MCQKRTKMMIGKSRNHVLTVMGDNYLSEYEGGLWIYEIPKNCFRKKRFLIFEFDENDIVMTVEKMTIDE